MKKFTLLTLIIAFSAALSMQSFAQTTLYESGFDDMTAGEYFVENEDSGFWTTWSNLPGTDEDAYVSDAQSSSPDNSVEVVGTVTDLLFLCGNKTSGKYQIDFKYYIVAGNGGYFNIQHFEVPGTEWAMEVYFGAAESGYATIGGTDYGFDFNAEEWIQISNIIDLDNDLAQLYINEVMIHEWPFHYQASGTTGTNQLGGFNIFAGAIEGETPHYYLDDFTFIELVAGSVSPIIDIDDGPIVEILEEGELTMLEREMSNLGEDDLNFQIVPTYDLNSKSSTGGTNYTYKDYPNKSREVYAQHNPNPTSQPNAERDETLRYDDGVNSDAIGNASDQIWRVAARFPADMVQPFIGMELYQMDVYINDLSLSHTAQVYGMGSFITPGPGTLLYEQDFDPDAASWNTITFDEPVIINGQNIWVGYMFDKPGGVYTPGCDAGPANPNGDWLSHGLALGWGHLAPALDYNWNIAAYLRGDLAPQWLSVVPDEGTLMQDEMVTVEISLDAAELTEDGYTGKLKIRNNDPLNDPVTILVQLVVVVGIDENPTGEYIMVYPNPATDLLRISNTTGNIRHITLTNAIGQIVVNEVVNAPNVKVDVSNLPTGVYFANIETAKGTATQKVIVE
jgi:hypothetical protein